MSVKLSIMNVPMDRASAIPVNVTPRQTQNRERLLSSTESKQMQSQGMPEMSIDSPGYQQLVEQMNRMARLLNRNYEFSVDEDTNQLVARVTDAETGEIVHQMPPEELLALASRIEEMMGVFLNELA